ncbi:MAG: hypothetical protein ACLQKH_11255 [Steroidobacteraceae bacterium]
MERWRSHEEVLVGVVIEHKLGKRLAVKLTMPVEPDNPRWPSLAAGDQMRLVGER